MSTIKVILYILIPLAIIIIIVKEFLLGVKIDTKDTLIIGIALLVLMWIGFFIIRHLLTRSATPKNIPPGGFQVVTKDSRKGEIEHTPAPKFYSTGGFQITHKGQRYGSMDSEEDRSFKMPVYKKPKPAPEKAQKRVRFGTAGIRGLINTEVTPLLVLKMSGIYGSYLGEKRRADILRVAVGYDSRYGSEMLKNSAISGLNSAGIHTLNCGCIPTGALASYIVINKLDGGILITGSHTPYNMTGFIILSSDGSYLNMETSRELENRYYNYDQCFNPVAPEKIGANKDITDVLPSYKDFLLNAIDAELIKSKRYRVLVDPANGPAVLILPEILKTLSCEVFLTNEQLSPVPARSSEPRANNLMEASAKVKEYQCNLGIATDVDADRVLFIDEKGSVLSEDLVGALFAR
ncbi:MAG: hypothetical protein QME51_04910, partial [Planctomycetota bacterium]|nr:hypothetical protein [Planctomycetota bacterium]